MFTEEQNKLLDALDARTKNGDNRHTFGEMFGVRLGVIEPKPYFPKVKDANGKHVKDENGYDKRSDTQEGWMYTFAEYSTCQPLRVVYPKKVSLPRGLYVISGRGFGSDMDSKFLDREVKIKPYGQMKKPSEKPRNTSTVGR